VVRGPANRWAADYLKKRGAVIISGDESDGESVDRDRKILKRLCEIFGESIVDSNGRLNRHKLGEIVFRNRQALMELNAIIHPKLLRSLKLELNNSSAPANHS